MRCVRKWDHGEDLAEVKNTIKGKSAEPEHAPERSGEREGKGRKKRRKMIGSSSKPATKTVMNSGKGKKGQTQRQRKD